MQKEMNCMKRILVSILSLLLLSFTLSNLCVPVFPSLVDTGQDSYLGEPDHCHHQETSCTNKIPCPDHSCCSMLTQHVEPYFVLEFSRIKAFGFFFQLCEAPQSIFHPPPFSSSLVTGHFLI